MNTAHLQDSQQLRHAHGAATCNVAQAHAQGCRPKDFRHPTRCNGATIRQLLQQAGPAAVLLAVTQAQRWSAACIPTP